jgi:hypothetical protein
LETLAQHPLDTIPQAADSWGDAKAMYRFFDNPRVGLDDLRTGLGHDTAQRCLAHPVILQIQDSTSFNFTHRALPELGPIDSGGLARGFLLHTTLASDQHGHVLGILSQQAWARPQPGQPAATEKESSKWLVGLEQGRQHLFKAAAPGLPPRLIHLMDREGDVWDVLQLIDDLGDSAVIRCTQNRRVDEPLRTAHTAVRAQPLLGVAPLTLPRSHARAAREVELQVRALTTELVPDYQAYPHAWPMTWTLVEAWEATPPEGAEAVHWLLWTREPARTLAEVLEVLRLYTCRWPVEEFHLTAKSGCRIEQLQLESWEGLLKAVTLYSAVAARIVALRDAAWQEPAAAATVLLSVEECEVLQARFGKGKTACVPLTIRQAVLWIGRLGGHLNRKGDGLPGVRTLWRGLRDLALLVQGYRIARRPQTATTASKTRLRE